LKMYDYRNRIYEPQEGIFIARDKMYYITLYTYTRNDPVNFVDPFGFVCTSWFKSAEPPGPTFTRISTGEEYVWGGYEEIPEINVCVCKWRKYRFYKIYPTEVFYRVCINCTQFPIVQYKAVEKNPIKVKDKDIGECEGRYIIPLSRLLGCAYFCRPGSRYDPNLHPEVINGLSCH